MTHIYQWFSFPEKFSVRCPNCGNESDCSEISIVKNHNGVNILINSGKDSKVEGEFIANLKCLHCGYNKEQQIKWPADAYWTFDIKGKTLWAWSKEHSKAILEYINSKEREQSSKYGSSFYHIPKHFKLAKNRDIVIRKIKKVIAEK